MIRTPISNRTFIIGGAATYKKVREVVYDFKNDDFKIELIKCVNMPVIDKNINLFSNFSKIAWIVQNSYKQYGSENDVLKYGERYEEEIKDAINVSINHSYSAEFIVSLQLKSFPF